MNRTDCPVLHWAGRDITPENKKLIVAVDHGFSFSNIEGLERPFDIVGKLASIQEVDGIIASLGIYKQAVRLGIDLSRMIRLLTVDYVAFDRNNHLREREIVLQPEDADPAEPHAYKMFFNVYDDSKELIRNVRDFERFVASGTRKGIASLAEVLFYENEAFQNPGTRSAELLRGCRLAMEAGADILKIPMTEDLDFIAEIADRLRLPIFLLGGAKCRNEEEMLGNLRRLAGLPIYGLMFGRNIWQSADMQGMTSKIAAALRS